MTGRDDVGELRVKGLVEGAGLSTAGPANVNGSRSRTRVGPLGSDG